MNHYRIDFRRIHKCEKCEIAIAHYIIVLADNIQEAKEKALTHSYPLTMESHGISMPEGSFEFEITGCKLYN